MTVIACGEPVPPRLIHFSPVILMVPAGERIAIRVVYETNDFEEIVFTWATEGGTIEGSGAGITYEAPEAPGAYPISVTATFGEGEERGKLTRETVVEVIPNTDLAHAALADLPAPRRDAEAAASTNGGETTDSETAIAAGAPATASDGDAESAEIEGGESTGSTPPPAAAAPAAGESRLDRILAEKELRAAVQIAFPPFSFEDDAGERIGFDVDLAREFARRWLDEPDAATLVPVTTAERLPALVEDRVDLVVAALTRAPARAEQAELGLTYFVDGQRLLVASDAEITDVCDLAGRKVAAIAGSTSLDNLKAAATECGFELGDDLVAFDRHQDAVEALLAGEVVAFTGDGVTLEALAEGQPLAVVGNHFSEEPYVIAAPKGDQRLRQAVDATLLAMATDGTFAALYAKWFGDSISPYPLEQIEIEGDTVDLEALTTSDTPALIEPASPAPARVTEHVVVAGDTLSKIAGKVYGDVSPASWRRLYEANRDLIGDDPSQIEVGMTLVVPE